jgi:hypothetical protein
VRDSTFSVDRVRRASSDRAPRCRRKTVVLPVLCSIRPLHQLRLTENSVAGFSLTCVRTRCPGLVERLSCRLAASIGTDLNDIARKRSQKMGVTIRAVQRIEASTAWLLHQTLHLERARAGRTDDRDRDCPRVWIKHRPFLCSPSARPTASPRRPNRLGTFGVRGPSAYDVAHLSSTASARVTSSRATHTSHSDRGAR